MRAIRRVIVHHSASEFGTLELVRGWHLQRGFDDIGYHYVVTNGVVAKGAEYRPELDGLIREGRPLTVIGAHAEGNNSDSVGVCLIGDGKFTRWQYVALIRLLVELNATFAFGADGVLGHCEVDPKRKPLCPGFDMELLRAALVCAKGPNA